MENKKEKIRTLETLQKIPEIKNEENTKKKLIKEIFKEMTHRWVSSSKSFIERFAQDTVDTRNPSPSHLVAKYGNTKD